MIAVHNVHTKDSLPYQYQSGAISVIYNNAGVPTYYPHEYKLHEYNTEAHIHVEVISSKEDWILTYDEGEVDSIIESYIPSLKESNSR